VSFRPLYENNETNHQCPITDHIKAIAAHTLSKREMYNFLSAHSTYIIIY